MKKLTPINAWALGFLLIMLFIALGQISVIFNDYVFHRLGLNRNIVLLVLWMIPIWAGFLTSYYSESYKLALVIPHVLALPVLGALAHLLTGMIGVAVDFSGVSGFYAILKIYFLVGSILIFVGSILGIATSRQWGSNEGRSLN